MNDSATRKTPVEIALASEGAFVLAGLQVRPAALEVEYEGAVTGLEPRVMQVLVALHRNHGEPVSRDALIDLCWGGRIVTEGALNRCVAQLRKALSPNPFIRLETIPKVGYRLRADDAPRANGMNGATSSGEPATNHAAVDAAARDTTESTALPAEPLTQSSRPISTPAETPPLPIETPPLSHRKRLDWKSTRLGLIAVGALTVTIWTLSTPRPVTWIATNYRPITTDRGLEVFPALSPDGEQIVYAQTDEPYGPTDLYLRNVDQGTPIRLTTDPADDQGATWSPSGNSIAFTRVPVRGPCTILVMPIPRGAERVVTRCETRNQTRASWLDERTLVIDDAPPGAAARIRAIDVQTGVARDLTSPPPWARGDAEPVVAPDGRHVVFRRTIILGADDLYVLDVATGRARALTDRGWKATGYAWSNDSRHVFFASNRGGEFGLWSADLLIDGAPRQVALGFGAISFSRMSVDRRNRLAVEMTRGPMNLARVTPSGVIEPVTVGSGSDWDAVAAHDGMIAHISNRTGSYQVWLTRRGGESVRLTSLPASYMTTPTWSPDDKTIAFVAVQGHRGELYTVARDGSQLRRLTNDGFEKQSPVYSASGDRIFYIARDERRWRLMQIGVAPGSLPQPVAGGEGWGILRTDAAGHLYGQRGLSIVTLDPTAPLIDVGLTEIDVWAVGPQGIYVRRGGEPQQRAIWFYPWRGPARKLVATQYAAGMISLDNDGAVMFSQSPDYQVDIGRIELRPDS